MSRFQICNKCKEYKILKEKIIRGTNYNRLKIIKINLIYFQWGNQKALVKKKKQLIFKTLLI